MNYELEEKYLRKVTKEDINALPLGRWGGPTHLVRTPGEVKKALKTLSGQPVLGFDTETRPTFKKGLIHPPSLLQLGTSDEVFIFQLSQTLLENGISELLADPGIIKAGVAVGFDVKELRRLQEFEPGGFTDLGEIARSLGMQTGGLRNLTANLLGFRISKSAQCSNWAKEALTHKQIVYAATDAWVSRELFLWFLERGLLPEEAVPFLEALDN